MIFDYITKLFSKEDENSVFNYTKPVDLEYFFIPLNKRGRYNHGLIACFNSISEETANFLQKYTDEANLNGIIDKQYLDRIPQDKKLQKKMDRIMDRKQSYSTGSFLFELFDTMDYGVLSGIREVASKILVYLAGEYQANIRPGETNTYMNEGWYLVGLFIQKYSEFLQLIPKAKKTKHPLKFLYYGRPCIAGYLFFYILVKNYCDVVVVSPKDYNYKEVVFTSLRNWIKYNRLIDSFESDSFVYFNTLDL